MSKLTIVAILAGLFLVGSFLIPGGSSVNVKKIYEEAEQAFQEKKYQEAIDKYIEALAEGEKWGADTNVIDEDFGSLANYKIAVCYAQLGKQTEDPAMYEKSLEYIPAIYEITQSAKVREALIFLWGSNFYELERYEEAEPKFRELLNDYPDSQFAENAYYSLGNLYYRLKQYEQSREAFNMVQKEFPNSTFIDDAQYFIARCFYDENNFDQAHIEFEKVQSVDNPDLVAQAKYYDGRSLLNMGRNQDALTAYQKFISDFPNSPFITAAYFDMGTIHGKLKEYDEATRNYQLAIQHTDDEVTKGEIQYSIGNNYFSQEDYQSAMDGYRALMEQYPESVHVSESRYMIAECYWWLKDYDNALAAYGEVLEKDPEGDRVPDSTYKSGLCYYELDEKEIALEWFQRILDDYPDLPLVKDATYDKIWSLNDLKRFEEAENVAKEYIEKYKSDPVYDIAAAETQMLLGDIKFDNEDYLAAADEYLRVASDYSPEEKLPKFDSYKSRSLLQAGFAYYKEAERNEWDTGLVAQAASAFDRLLKDYEINFDKEKREFEGRVDYIVPAIINLGLSYSKMGEYAQAREALELMPKTSSEYGKAMFLIGESYIDEDNVDEGVNHYRSMLTDPDLTETWRSRAAIEMATRLREAGRFAEAVVEYQRVVEDYPTSEFVSTAMYYVGSSYYDMEPKTPENMNKSIEAFRKVLEVYPESEVAPWSYLGIVAAYEANGEYDMVIKIAEEIDSKYAGSDSPDAKQIIDHSRRRKVDAMMKLDEGVSTDILIAELRKVVEDPIGEETGKVSAQARIGKLLFDEKRYAESIKEYEYLLNKFPGQQIGASYYQIAAAAYWMEDYQKTVSAAEVGLKQTDLTDDLKAGLSYTLGLAYGKLGNANSAIASFGQTIQIGGSADSEQTQDIVIAAHRELARSYKIAGQFDEAVKEYQFLADNAKGDDEKSDSFFWIAKIYEENLQDYVSAVTFYEKIGTIDAPDEFKAQSLYFIGVVYSKHLQDDENSLSAFQKLVADHASNTDENIKLMVSDANLRIPELLIKLGKFGNAVELARQVRDDTLAGDNKQEQINAQYQVAYLLGDQAGKAADSGTSDPDLARDAATEYIKVYDLIKPMNQASEETKPLASASLYNAGYLLYGLGTFEDYKKALDVFSTFVREFPKDDNYSASLEYVGFASYEMARLKADLDQFVKTGEYFKRFSREFPSHNDAAMAMYQAAEAYFAVGGGHFARAEELTDPNEKAKELAASEEGYGNAVEAYRELVDRFPNSEYAPESLYAMSASYSYIAQSAADPAAQNRALIGMSAAYKELSEKYPQSENAAKAFLSVGNDYYNQASAPDLPADQKTELYRKSLDSYKKALQVPGVDDKTKMTLQSYVRETEELLAKDTYSAGYGLVLFDLAGEVKRENAPKAIPYFDIVIETFPDTDYADLSYVQLGLCYEYLEKWDESEKAYSDLLGKYTDENGNPIAPFSENVVQAVQFARERKGKIMAYRIAIRSREQSQE